jgi:hypothetical protein
MLMRFYAGCPVLRETFERRTARGKGGMDEVPRWPTESRRLAFSMEQAYLDLIKTGFDWALPPPATMMTNDIPALASGTVASIAVSLMNLNRTGVFEAALKVTV